MGSARILKFKLNPDKQYSITKILDDGKLKPVGWDTGLGIEITVGQRLVIARWSFSPVQEIVLIGKGVIIETENSTYLIEEMSSDDIIRDDSKE